MESYTTRASRIDLSFPVIFVSEEKLVAGHCLNLSESGLLANFDQPLELWSMGELLIHGSEAKFRVPVRVARANEYNAGLAFRFTSDEQRASIQALVAYAATRTHLHDLRPPF